MSKRNNTVCVGFIRNVELSTYTLSIQEHPITGDDLASKNYDRASTEHIATAEEAIHQTFRFAPGGEPSPITLGDRYLSIKHSSGPLLKIEDLNWSLGIAASLLADKGLIRIRQPTLFFGGLHRSGELHRSVGALAARIQMVDRAGYEKIITNPAERDIYQPGKVTTHPGDGVAYTRKVLPVTEGLWELEEQLQDMTPVQGIHTLIPRTKPRWGSGTCPKDPQILGAAFVAAVTGMSLRLDGGPSSGRVMMARFIASILPRLSNGDMLALSAARSVGGVFRAFEFTPPFRAPHHSCSHVSLYGNDRHVGEIILAHGGVLLLDDYHHMNGFSWEAALKTPTFYEGIQATPLRIGIRPKCPCGGWMQSTRCDCHPQQIKNFNKSCEPRDRCFELQFNMGTGIYRSRAVSGDLLKQWVEMVTAARQRYTANGYPNNLDPRERVRYACSILRDYDLDLHPCVGDFNYPQEAR